MGHGYHVLPIISLIIFCLVSFYFTHVLIAKSTFNANDYFNFAPTRKEVYYTGFNGVNANQNQVLNSIVEKFRVLLGFKSYITRKSRNGEYGYTSRSPSPSPSPAPAPSPLPHIYHRAHPPRHQPQSLSPAHKIQKKDENSKAKRVLTAVLTSVGVICILCAIGLSFLCRKFKKQKRRPKRNVPMYRSEAGNKGISKFLSSQASVKKVSSAPGPDLFYLNSLETALEPNKCCLKLDYETEKTYFNKSMSSSALEVDEREESNEKLINSEFSSGKCSSIGEITTVHEITESIRHERVALKELHTFDDRIVLEEAHSSDDESFHSLCDSHSSQRRLSNASVCNLNETLKIEEDMSMEAQGGPSEILHSNSLLSTSTSQLQPHYTLSPPPPPTTPPPPPPPQYVHISPPLPGPSSSVETHCGLTKPSTLPSVSSPGIPPPPCPPPFMKGHIYLPKVPPPPSQTSQIPLGKDGSPLAKLKPLHWDKVRAAPDRSTVWDKLRSSSFEFDEEMIESLFGYDLQNQMKKDEVKSKTPSPSKHVLDPKRFQNFTILSKALNVTAEQVCGALIRGDGLSLQDLEALSKMVPTKEEEANLSNYKGDILELGSAEKLVKLMLKIPFGFARIEAMLYKESFDDEVHHLRKSFSMLEEACKELRSSRLFLKLLEAVLKTGNRMNVGTIRGEARAFKLDALLKLADVKGTDGKTTLLHFVVQEIVRSEGIRVSESIMGKINQKSKTTNTEDKEEFYRKMGLDLVTGLSTELCNVKKTATVDLDVIASSVANLAYGLSKLQKLVQNDMIMEEKKGSFVSSMRLFLNYAEMKLKELQEDENKVLLHVREITEYFHGHVSKDESNPLRIFVIVRDFLSMLDHVCKELKSSKAPCYGNPLAPFR